MKCIPRRINCTNITERSLCDTFYNPGCSWNTTNQSCVINTNSILKKYLLLIMSIVTTTKLDTLPPNSYATLDSNYSSIQLKFNKFMFNSTPDLIVNCSSLFENTSV